MPIDTAQRRAFLATLTSSGVGLAFAPMTAYGAVPAAQPKTGYPDDITITDVKTYILGRCIFVKVETNTGISGWGESSPNSREIMRSFIEDLKRFVIGQNPFNTEYIWDQMFWGRHDLGPSGALTYAIAGIDLAIWDFKGKYLNEPVCHLLGSTYRRDMTAYCGIPLRGGAVSTAEATARALKLVDLGFQVIKLRMQIRESNLDPVPDPTLRYYEAVRKALPDHVDLFVDPNEGYTAARAISIGKALQAMGMKYYESPCPLENHRDTAEVVRALDIPVMAGEKCYTRWQVRDLILEANPDMIQPDTIKSGGITEMKKIAALGQTFFKALVPHNTKPTLGTAATLHLLASVSNAGPFLEFVELDTYQDVLAVFDTLVPFEEGRLKLPEGPGLGVQINEARLLQVAR